MTAHELAGLIHNHRFPFHDEDRLQESIGLFLDSKSIPYQREYRLNSKDRIDFMVGTVGIEVKVASSMDSVRMQLWRYAKSEEITDLILVTTKSSHREIASEILGKCVYVVHLINSFF